MCGLIVRVRVVPRRTVVGDTDRRFDNLSGSHHQSHTILNLTSRSLGSGRPSLPSQGLVVNRLTSKSNWNLEVLVFVEEGKPEKLKKKTLAAWKEPTTNSTTMRRGVRESNPGHRGGRRTLIHCAIRAPNMPTLCIGRLSRLIICTDQ